MRRGFLVLVSVLVATPALADMLIYDFPLDTDPGWTTEGDWAFGRPTGQGGSSGGPDPTSGYTGDTVYGYNLQGDYRNNLSPGEFLQTQALNFRGMTNVRFHYRRWLGIQDSRYDHARIQVSTDGINWQGLWHNPSG